VRRRGISDGLAETFGIGFAPDAWDSLASFLGKRGFQPGEMEKAGLALRRRDGSGVYDRFRNRLMIPLCDAHGGVVGFTGRIMPKEERGPKVETRGTEDDGPKYLNSPETAVFRKGRILYGLHLAKQAIKREGRVVIVEGNLDVVASRKAGVEHVVGSSGTALTEEQLATLKRFTTTIVFSFDADAAGFKAARRGIALARSAGFDVRVAVLPPDAGKDPDEAVQKDPELWRASVSNTVPIMQYYVDRAAAGRDLANVDDKRAVAALVVPELAGIADAVEREHWLQTVADLLRMDVGVLRDSIRPAAAGKTSVTKLPAASSPPRPGKHDLALRALLAFSMQDSTVRGQILHALEGRAFQDDALRTLYTAMRAEYDANQSLDQAPPSYFGRLQARMTGSDHDRSVLHEIALHGEELVAATPPDRVSAQVQELLQSLSASDRGRRRKAIEADMRRAEQAGDQQTVEKLIREFNALR
jgi:DNA primase